MDINSKIDCLRCGKKHDDGSAEFCTDCIDYFSKIVENGNTCRRLRAYYKKNPVKNIKKALESEAEIFDIRPGIPQKPVRKNGDLFEPVPKTCRTCGKQFSATRVNTTYCSPECRENGIKDYKRRYREDNKEYYRQYSRNRYRMICTMLREKTSTSICKICGKPVEPYWNSIRRVSQQLHESCIIEDVKTAIRNQSEVSELQRLRCYSRGISIKELRDEVKDEHTK